MCARQNGVFEHGFLMGKNGRSNVCALIKDDVESPNDIAGVVYVTMDPHDAWMNTVAKEMKEAGYDIDLNKL
ncbi:TIR domain-containing protein [Peribacillus butanolivorans]|uniref:TIR domain-containing protein n=1 Tax=Peribacillus butanolivorans TaxID=421767 RepID=UPI003647F326